MERIDEHGALVNVGAKSEGLVPPEELGTRNVESINVGDEIAVYVVDNGTGREYHPVEKESRLRAGVEQLSSKAYENSETLTAMVIDRVKGGLVVDLGIAAFCRRPMSRRKTSTRWIVLSGNRSSSK